MSLTPGTRIGPYEIAAQIGVGGMGEVYRAVDSNLGRSVAIKVLPDIFSQDPDRLARFEREAKTLASLNHPNIAQVFGLEKGASDSGRQTQALVMELVEGPTLADRIAEGAIPLDEAVPIAIQIAEALETAHDQGIVHRDLKPANVKVRADGTVKVLDFGLAKAMAPAGEVQSGTLANSPTITSPAMTQAGVVLGTAAYMSPEQAKGRAVDRRADIWSFGCVLFEMLTAKRAFAGDDISDVLVAILRDEPPWTALPAATPPHIRALLRRCLQKDPKKRLPHIGVARLELAEGGQAEVMAAAPAARSFGNRIIAPIAWALAGAAAVGAVWFALRPAATNAVPSQVVRFEITPPEGYRFTGANAAPRFAVSPDGVSVAFQLAQLGKRSQLWLRRLDASESRPIPNTEATESGEEAQQPFWSPDGRYLAFFDGAAEKLKKVDLQSGLLQVLADVPRNQYAGSWNADGVIIMATVATNGVRRVSASGGPVTQVTTLDKASGETSHLWPEFLPDGRHFIYLASRAADQNGRTASVFVADLDGGRPKRLLDTTFLARFAPPDQIVFVRDGSLVAQRFDLDRLELSGEPVLVANSILGTQEGRAAFSLSRTGVLVYASGDGLEDNLDAVWLDRSGRQIVSSALPRGVSAGIRLSPDGKLLAFTRGSAIASTRAKEIWLYDTTRQVETRLTADDGITAPVFSPDGSRVAFSRATTNGAVSLHQQPVSGAAGGEPLLRSAAGTDNIPSDWSPDGRLLVYSERNSDGPRVWILPVVGDRKPYRFLEVSAGGASWSPDGRWLVFSSNRQVFVQTFPDASAGRWPVSGPGGSHARWRRDGREIFFVTGQRLWSVPVRTDPRFEVGEPAPLFEIPNAADLLSPTTYSYDVSPDGQRFVVLRRRADANSARITLVLNWMAALNSAR